MADEFDLEVATPERLIVHERVTTAQIPARDGYIGVRRLQGVPQSSMRELYPARRRLAPLYDVRTQCLTEG